MQNKILLTFFTVFSLLLAGAVPVFEKEGSKDQLIENKESLTGFSTLESSDRPQPPPYLNVFTPLRPGQVKAAGWLKAWSEEAAAGIVGELDQQIEADVAKVFTYGWKGVDAYPDP